MRTRTAARCDRHVGEPYPPRCTDCDDVRPIEFAPLTAHGECTRHPHYVDPCDRCIEDAVDPLPAPTHTC